MLVIHIFHVFAKLSTLKRSRLEAISALKHSRFCAETLPRSIYAYIYLYKKTSSWQQQNVNNFFNLKSKAFMLCLVSFVISGCCKQNQSEMIQNSALNISSPPYKTFRQIPGNTYKPSAYFTHCEMRYPCLYASKIKKPITFSKVSRSNKSNHFNFKGE